jgi:hypothetical protein
MDYGIDSCRGLRIRGGFHLAFGSETVMNLSGIWIVDRVRTCKARLVCFPYSSLRRNHIPYGISVSEYQPPLMACAAFISWNN